MSADGTKMSASKFLEHLSSLNSNQKSMLTGELIIYLTEATQRELDLKTELASVEDKLHKISQWCQAYPIEGTFGTLEVEERIGSV